jgi:hypothetical protein
MSHYTQVEYFPRWVLLFFDHIVCVSFDFHGLQLMYLGQGEVLQLADLTSGEIGMKNCMAYWLWVEHL